MSNLFRRYAIVLLALLFVAPAQAQTAAESAILSLESARFDAQVARDVPALTAAIAEDAVYIHASGVTQSRADYLKDVAAGTSRYRSIEAAERTVHITGNIAITHGLITLNVGVDKRIMARYTGVYIKRGGRWLLLSWQSTPVPAAPVAQAAPESPRGYTGAVVSIADDSVVLRLKDGTTATVAMSPGWTVGTARELTIDAVKPGDFIASINVNVDAATGRANEFRVFEPGYRPEVGTHAMPQPNTSITHGWVTGKTATAEGTIVDIGYPGGSRRILVPAGMKVIVYDLRERALAAPGVTVTAITRRGSDDVWRAGRLLVVPE